MLLVEVSRGLYAHRNSGGPASDQIDAGIAFVARFMETPADKPTSDIPPYDLDVVDEAIVNAVAHRDYAISGSKIRLFLFTDRLELYSPASCPTPSRSTTCPTARSRGTSFW